MKIPRPSIDLTFLKDFISKTFSFGRRELLIILSVFGVTVIAAVIITVIVISRSGRGSFDKAQNQDYQPVAEYVRNPEVSEKPFLSDFMLYEDQMEESFTGVVYSRERRESWSDEQAGQYWQEPEEILADQLEIESEKIIKDIFADVP